MLQYEKRYIYKGGWSKIYHDRSYLTEVCNTDSIEDRKESDSLPPNRLLCGHCARQKEKEEGVE